MHNLEFDKLRHLVDIGVLNFDPGHGVYLKTEYPKIIKIYYNQTPYNLEFQNEEDNTFEVGQVLLTQIGQELARITKPKPIPGFEEYVFEKWSEKRYLFFSPWPWKK